jgi:hypothetical protein
MGFPLSVICCGRPIELDKPHVLALAAETGFLLFKEQVPLKFKKEMFAVQCERKTFRLISLSTPVSFRWTVPLIKDFMQAQGSKKKKNKALKWRHIQSQAQKGQVLELLSFLL